MTPEQIAALFALYLASDADLATIVADVPEAGIADARSAAAAEVTRLHEGIRTSATPIEDAAQVALHVAFVQALDVRTGANEAARQSVADLAASLNPPAPAPAPAVTAAAGTPANPAPAPAIIRPADPDLPNVGGTGNGRPALVAAAGGSEFTDRLGFATAMTAALENMHPSGRDGTVRRSVGSITNYNRTVTLADDGNANEAMLLSMQREIQRNPEAITAATGPFCAPAEPIYDFFELPIGGLANWPTVDAPRGRRMYPVSPSIIDVGLDVDWMAALGSQANPKDCFLVECGDTVTGEVVSYPLCLLFDNFTGRFYPELVANRIALSVARFGFVIQGALLNTIETTLSTNLAVENAGGGFLMALFRALSAGAARYRSKYYMPNTAVLNVDLPAWVPDAIAVDIVSRAATLDFDVTRARVLSILGSLGLNIQWLNGWQPIPATGWETTAINALMYAPGTLVRLSGGDLNIGVQRDGTLNRANQYQIFQETWDGITKVGFEVSRLTGIEVCANGDTGDAATITCGTLNGGS